MADHDAARPGVDPDVLRLRRRRRNRLLALIVLVVLVTLLGVDNRHDVEVEYLVGEARVRLVWVILASFAVGAVFERMYTFVRGRRRADD